MSVRGEHYNAGYEQGYRDGWRAGSAQIGLVLSFPWRDKGDVRLCGPFPLPLEGWQVLMDVLNQMQRVLCVEEQNEAVTSFTEESSE